MSQLERALKKARAEGIGLPPAGGGRAGDTRQPPSTFVSAWDFEDSADRAAVAQPVSKPTAESRRLDSATAPVVASTAARLNDFNPAIREKLVVGDRAPHELKEQFRKVAASLYRLREARPLKVIMIASAAPGEGKTLTATNLALTLSESYGSRVLLLDADLRRPSLHDVFDIPNTSGLREGLNGNGGTISPVRISAHLDVLTAGQATMDPMSALTSERLRNIVEQAAATFDWVLVDTPPVELLPDAKLLTSLADGAILVVQAESTPCRLAQQAVETIGRERIVGVVLNRLTERSGPDDYTYYGYYADRTGRL